MYTYWYEIHQYFLQMIANAIQPLAQSPCKNCRELSNFICKISCFFKNIQLKITTKFIFSILFIVFCLFLFCLCQAYPKIHLYVTCSHCYANTFNSKGRSNRLLNVSHQRNPKTVCKYSLG